MQQKCNFIKLTALAASTTALDADNFAFSCKIDKTIGYKWLPIITTLVHE